MSDKTMLMVTPTGARRTTKDHSWLPITPEAVALDVKACVEEGAGAIHIHVRGPEQVHSLDAGLYRDMIAAIKQAVGDNLFMQITTEAVGIYQPDTQMALVRDIVPESASFAIRELIPDDAHEETAAAFFAWVKEAGIVPQFLIYEAKELERFKRLCVDGILPFKRPFCLFAMGYHGKYFAKPEDVTPYVDAMVAHDLDLDWGVCSFGNMESKCVAAAVKAGGHGRVGFENNIEAPDGSPLTSNAQAVTLAAKEIGALGKGLMTGPEIRSYLQAQLA